MIAASPASLDRQADGLMELAEEYRLQVVELLRGRHTANAKMLAYLEGRGGTIADFNTMHTAHEILTRDLADALMCLGAAVDCEGVA